MTIQQRIEQDTVAAMKGREQARLEVLRMVKAALKNREIDKRAPLTDAEVLQILNSLVKQRRDSIEQFTRGNRPELAAKEAAEITVIEGYLPREADESRIRELTAEAIAEAAASGSGPTARDMGAVIRQVQAKVAALGLRADGRRVSEVVKAALAG